ncbi:hypothetical protein ABKN59_005492 [Abortiporus biennis]
MAQTTPALPRLDDTLGAVFIGVTIAAILYGVTCVQTYTYYAEASKRDRLALRALIGALWILDGLQLAFVAHLLYYFVITNYFNPVALQTSPWSAEAFNVVTNIADLIVRSILIYRTWRSASAKFQQIGNIEDLSPIKGLIIGVFSCIACIDTSIAVALVAILWGRRTGFERTDSQLQTLMVYSVHTGALTSLVAICVVITFATMPTKFIYIALFFTLPKFYINALLATLNARETIIRSEWRSNPSSGLSGVHVSRTQISSTSVDCTQHPNFVSNFSTSLTIELN